MDTLLESNIGITTMLATSQSTELTSHITPATKPNYMVTSSYKITPKNNEFGSTVLSTSELDKIIYRPLEVDTIAYKVGGVDTTAEKLPELDTPTDKAPNTPEFNSTKWSLFSNYSTVASHSTDAHINDTFNTSQNVNKSFVNTLLTLGDSDEPYDSAYQRTIPSSSSQQTFHSPAQLLRTAGSTVLNDTVGYISLDSNHLIGTDPALLNMTLLADDSVTQANNNGSNFTELQDMASFVSLNYNLPVMIVISVLLLTLVVITAFGNFLVGLALFKFKNLRTVSNYLIGNLALSDFLLATTILPLSAVNEALGHWIFGRYACYCWLCVDVLYCTASIWNLCMIAFDRFTATLYPLWYREKRSAKQAAIYIALVWSVAIGVCIPPLLGWNDITQTYFYDENDHVYQCWLFDNATYVVYSASGSFYIPFVITTFLYVRIFIVLRQRVRSMHRARKKQLRAVARPLLEKEEEEKAQATQNTLVVERTEIEMHATTTPNETSHQTDDSSKSMRSSESLSRHSDDDTTRQMSHNAQNGKDRNGETTGLLTTQRNTVVATTTDDEHGNNEKETALVIYNSTHNHTCDNEKATNGSDVQHKVNVVVTLDTCNGTSSSNNEAMKQHVKTTALKKSKQNHQTNLDTNSKHCNNNISHFKFMNIIKSPKPTRRVSQRQRRQDRETKATIRMAIIIAFFCGFWIGFFTTYLLRGIFGNHFYIPRQLDAIFFWLGYSNSAINPILYTIFNEDFRKAFQKILGCYRKGRRPGGYSRTRN